MAEALGEGNGQASPDDSFAQLRSIIVGPERRDLRALQAHVLDPAVQTHDVSRVLPDALQLRANDPQLMRALAPSIEKAITASVTRDPRPLADALFPVIGPAIRKAVAHTFEAMLESLNHTIERSVSWQAVKWRWTAWRTGKSFAEIVLLDTLEYRVEQVFLIHRETGLLLQHVTVDGRAGEDADQISAMLTAIRDFARDSFDVAGSESLESLRVGDLSIVIEQGPHAILAAVVRGVIPAAVRPTFQGALESVHRQFLPDLQAFDGDASVFDGARPILQACLVSQRRTERRPASMWRWALVFGVLLLAAGVWMFLGLRDRQRWNAYVERLSSEPGIVVLSSGRRAGKFFVAGLRDPLATDPASLMAASRLSPDAIESRWEDFEAQHPRFVTERARLLLRPPPGVTLTFAGGLLTATGTAPAQWIADTERIAPALAGVRRFAYAGQSAEDRLKLQIERARIGFSKAQAAIEPRQQPAMDALVSSLRELNAVLAASGGRAAVEAVGHADSDGPDDLNTSLSRARAEEVLAVLRAASLDRIDLSGRGVGRAPVVPGATPEQHEQNRRVEFLVRLPEARSPGSVRP